MATPFQDIYDKFLSLIDDLDLALLPDVELKIILFNYLSGAKSLYFKQCKKDLNDYDKDLEQFNVDLTDEEQWIIANGMVLFWLEPKIKTERLIRNSISDKNYQESSHANQLGKLMDLETSTRNKLKEYIINYTYSDFDGFY